MPSINIDVDEEEYKVMSEIKGNRTWKEVLKTKLPKIPISMAFDMEEYNKLIKLKDGSWRKLVMDLYNKSCDGGKQNKSVTEAQQERRTNEKSRNKEELLKQTSVQNIIAAFQTINDRNICKDFLFNYVGGDRAELQKCLGEMAKAEIIEKFDDSGETYYNLLKDGEKPEE